MPITSLEDSFEKLAKDEWESHLSFDGFNGLHLDLNDFYKMNAIELVIMNKFKMNEIVDDYINQLFSLKISYCLCRHYYDKGIPDDPYYEIDANNHPVQLFPNFREEHWMRRFWFCYFADMYYLKFSSLWDAFYYTIGYYYGLNEEHKNGHNDRVLKKIKEKNEDVYRILQDFRTDSLTQQTCKYRNLTSHGSSTMAIHDTVEISKPEFYDFPQLDSTGNIVFDINGNRVTKKEKAIKISYGYGVVAVSSEIMKNMELYTISSAKAISSVMKLI